MKNKWQKKEYFLDESDYKPTAIFYEKIVDESIIPAEILKKICDGYFNCGWGDTMGYGSIPKKQLESPEWYSTYSPHRQ